MQVSNVRMIGGRLVAIGLCAGVLFAAAPEAAAHEPVFGLGPHTLYEGGFSSSLSYEHDLDTDGEDANRATLGLTYGVNANLNLAVGLPYVIHQPVAGGHVDGVGDPVVQVKWRPWASFSPRNVDALSLVGAVELPAGEEGVSPGNTGYVVGATAARENLRYYLFSSVRYVAQTVGLAGKPRRHPRAALFLGAGDAQRRRPISLSRFKTASSSEADLPGLVSMEAN